MPPAGGPSSTSTARPVRAAAARIAGSSSGRSARRSTTVASMPSPSARAWAALSARPTMREVAKSVTSPPSRRVAAPTGPGSAACVRDRPDRVVQRRVLQQHDRVVDADRRSQHPECVLRRRRRPDRQARDVMQQRLDVAGVDRPQPAARALGHPQHEGRAHAPARHRPQRRRVVGELVIGQAREGRGRQLGHRSQAGHRRSDRRRRRAPPPTRGRRSTRPAPKSFNNPAVTP